MVVVESRLGFRIVFEFVNKVERKRQMIIVT